MGINQKTDVFVGIDGTGPSDNTEYALEFDRSHVRTLSRKPFKYGVYWRGPSLLGAETLGLAEKATEYVVAKQKQIGDIRVFMSGYSRGGAAVLAAANMLAQMKPNPIPVYGLFLFDAVNRTHNVSQTQVPSNVQYTFHALRSPASASRTSFGNCGHPGAGRYAFRHFFCTHGGVGGTPWRQGGHNAGEYINEASVEESVISRLALYGTDVTQYLSQTNVTFAQDMAGSKASGAWMSQMFDFVA